MYTHESFDNLDPLDSQCAGHIIGPDSRTTTTKAADSGTCGNSRISAHDTWHSESRSAAGQRRP
jgi:hypothetical protein